MYREENLTLTKPQEKVNIFDDPDALLLTTSGTGEEANTIYTKHSGGFNYPDRTFKGDHAALLGRKTAKELAVGLAPDVYFTGGLTKDTLKEMYPQAFTGLGKLTNYELKLNIDESVTHVAQPIRRIPFSRREKVVQKLKELENVDVIEKVDDPTQWVNPPVTEEKPNGEVRVCLDMRETNKAIIKERQPISTVDRQYGIWGNEGVHKARPEHGIPPGRTTSRLSRCYHVRSTKWSVQIQVPCIRVEHGLREVQSSDRWCMTVPERSTSTTISSLEVWITANMTSEC